MLVYFRKDIARILAAWFRQFGSGPGRTAKSDPDVRMGWFIIVGTLPIVIVGFLLQDAIRSTFRSLWLVAIVLIVFGLLLGAADLLGRRTKKLDDLTWRDGLLYGAAQTLALVPGVSRSGATTTMGRLLGYERPSVATFSFLLAVPAVFGSGLYELYSSVTDADAVSPFGAVETLAATVVAFAVGLAVIAFLMGYIRRRSFLPFVIYRLLLGVTLLVLLGTGVLDPL